MNKLCCLIGMFITCGVCDAQNLIPNGNFELYSGCPNGFGQLDSASFWINPTGGTPDYFNSCVSNTMSASVPINWFGYQQSHSGVAYAGICMIFPSILNIREYIETPIVPSLTANTCYHFEMYVNLGDNCEYTTNAIGIYFSNTVVTGISGYLPLPFTPQVNNSSGVLDTLNWTLISANYTATGGESFLIIGNYKDDSNTNPIIINSSAGYNGAYCYIDDVSLSLCTGIEEQTANGEAKIYPNPFNDKLTVRNIENELSEILLYDIGSRKLLQQSFTNSSSINTEQLEKGIYLYELRNKNGVIKKGKVVKD